MENVCEFSHLTIHVVCERFTYSDIFESIYAQKKEITKLISHFQRREQTTNESSERRSSKAQKHLNFGGGKKCVYTQATKTH